jgi:hypothetical protein
MPYGLFDFEDTIEPMGLSPQFNLSPNTQQGRANLGLPILNKIPAPTPQNTGIVTKAIPENPPQQVTTMAIPENAPSQFLPSFVTRAVGEEQIFNPPMVTDAMIGNEAPPIATAMAYGENSFPYNPSTLAMIPSEMPPNVTLAIPENGVLPTPPSGQCPTGYQPSNPSSPIKPPPAQFYAPIGEGRYASMPIKVR